MKRPFLALLLVAALITPCYAVNPVDAIACKRVVLCAIHMTVLVQRLTGEVKYILQNNGKWKLLTGVEKSRCQSMYEAQTKLKLVCR